jgi:hypothetical protein
MWQPIGISGAVRYDISQSLTTAQQLQARSNVNSVSKSGDTITGNFTINGAFTINNGNAIVNGDISAVRPSAPNTGVIYLGNANHYLYFDGVNYKLDNAPVYASNGRLWGAGDMTPVNKAGDTMTGLLTTVGESGTINQGGGAGTIWCMGAGGANEAFMTFHRPSVFACNFGLGTDNNFWMGGWSFGAGTQYRFWTTRDFTSVPSTAACVTNGRLVFVADYQFSQGGGMVEPYGGAVLTGLNTPFSGYVVSVQGRYRYMQLYTTGWFTVGYA